MPMSFILARARKDSEMRNLNISVL